MALVVALVGSLLVACGTKDSPKTENGDGLKVGLVLAGGLGDRSFYDSANEGVEKAAKELGITHKVYECRNDPTLIKDQLVQASEDSDIVAAVGFEFYDAIQEISKEFEDVDYIYVDNEIPGVENLITISYAENEGSFLAGALAALMTTETDIEGINPDKNIGMVGGEDIDVIKNFQVGYEAGAKYIDPDMNVSVMYAQDFEDPAKGKEIATVLYNKGADIIFQVAGKTGEGVFEAAKELGKFAIGVDNDQRYINPDRIMASMVKKVGQSIYDMIELIQKDEVKRGEVQIYGLAENAVGMSYGEDGMTQIVPEEMKEKIEEIKAGILAGDIEVPAAK